MVAVGLSPKIRRWAFTLFGDVKPLCSVRILILASEEFSEDGIISGGRKVRPRVGGCGAHSE